MWILTEAPRGSNYFEPQSTIGNKALISDTCEIVIYARSQGADGFRLVAQRGRDSFFIGPAPARGAVDDTEARMMELARQLGAVIVA